MSVSMNVEGCASGWRRDQHVFHEYEWTRPCRLLQLGLAVFSSCRISD